jgi:phospholipase/carboxylesterase
MILHTRLYAAGHELTAEMAGDFGRWVGERTGLK